jgi:phospholipase/lecithinase/hemolysin
MAQRADQSIKHWSTSMKTFNRFLYSFCLLAITGILPPAGMANTSYERVAVFGDSLSDPGNAYALFGMSLVPPYTDLVPEYPYARGGHHLSDGPTWIEQLATRLRQADSVGPALEGPGVFSNYATDRTRACPGGASYIDLTAQVGMFIENFKDEEGNVPSDVLYVMFVGSNDVRDVLVSQDTTIIRCALNSISSNIMTLVDRGATDFLVPNVPNLGVIPAVTLQGTDAQDAATYLSSIFNAELETMLSFIEGATYGQVRFHRVDTFTLISEVSSTHPGLNVTDACINVFAGTVCEPASRYLFWDGIHPTRVGHAILAEEAARELGLAR